MQEIDKILIVSSPVVRGGSQGSREQIDGFFPAVGLGVELREIFEADERIGIGIAKHFAEQGQRLAETFFGIL